MPKKSNKKSIKITNEKEENENENENEDNNIKLLNSKILKYQKNNYDNYVNNFLKRGGIISLAC